MKTADPELMRAINRFHVLDTIRRRGAIARVQIGEQTQLSPTTISAITAALLEDGLITVINEGDIRDQTARGRPRVMLALNPQAASVVGAKLGPAGIVVVTTNFQGDVLASISQPLVPHETPEGQLAENIAGAVRLCVEKAGLALSQIKAFALSFAGIIEHGSGNIVDSAVLMERGPTLRNAIFARLRIATTIESDANAVAMAQHWFGLARDLDDFVLVSTEPALGLAVMHSGQLFRGAHGLSLTLANMVMNTAGSGLVRLVDLAGSQPSHTAHLNKSDAAERATASGTALGIAIANLVSLFAPPRIILVGSSLTLEKARLDALQQAFASAVPPPLAGIADIVIDEVSDQFWARGAAAMALAELYGSPWGTTGPAYRTLP